MGELRGGLITKRPLCLSHDGKMFFAPCGNDIRIYSAISGELLASLRGHTAAVTAVAQDPSSPHQLYSSGRDGTLRLWNYDSGALLRTYNVEGPAESMVVSRQLNVAYMSLQHGTAGRVVAMQLPSGELLSGRLKPRAATRLFVSPSGAHVATIDHNSLFVWSAGSQFPKKPFNFHHIRLYTCAAMNARDDILAAGDVSGRILIWRNFTDVLQAAAQGKAQQPPCTTLHWHPHAVGCLAFSPDSNYLLSGGQEATLVQWQLDNNRRSYLPRLGGALTGITPINHDATRYLVAQADNVVRVINVPSWAVECSVMGLRPPPATLPFAPVTTAVLQPGTGHLVLPCDNSMLQFFDAMRDSHVGKLQVAQRNYVSMTDAADACGLYGPPAQPHVTQLAFGPGAASLATIDVRPTIAPGGGVDSTLKFWDRAPPGPAGTTPYMLNTLVDEPHRGLVTGLAHHPTEDLVASSSDDGEFKVWVRTAQKHRAHAGTGTAGGKGASSWRCAAVGSYRNQPLGACAFSPDGSLLAVGTGSAGAVTLWQPDSNTLIARLAAPPVTSGAGGAVARAALGPVVRLAFLTDTPHLVGTTAGPNPAVIVWDLLTVSAAWSVSLETCALAVDPAHALFAVGVPAASGRSGQALVFGLQQAWPLSACPLGGSSPAALMFVAGDTALGAAAERATPAGMSPLLIVTDDRKFAIASTSASVTAAAAGDVTAEAEATGTTAHASAAGQGESSALEAMFGRTQPREAVSAAGVAQVEATAVVAKNAVALLFDAPSHVLPPPTSLCPMLLDLLISGSGEAA